MTPIDRPVAGQPMRAGWGAAVADRLNQLGPFGVSGMLLRDGPFGQGSAPLPRNQRDRRGTPAAPQPYEVRWDPGLSNGDGGWKIYLPGEHLLRVDGEYIDELGGVTAIEDDNGDETGWFEFDEIDASATAIWLVVAKEESGNEGEATVSAQFAAEEGEGVQNNICIAEVSFTAATQSAAAVVEIRQSVVGALALTPGGEETPPKPFEYVETQEEGEGGEQRTVKSIVNLDFYWDGEQATATLASGFEVPATGNVFLCCVGTPSQSASAVHGYEWSFTVATSEASAPQGGKVANYKLYTFSGGEMTMDWRATFLALSSNTFAAPDNLSIDATGGTSHQQLQIKGYAGATIGMAPVKRQNGIVWEIVPLLTTATLPATCVLSTGAADVGSSNEAARADHVHKLPTTVVDTINAQTIRGAKTFTDNVRVQTSTGECFIAGRYLNIKSASNDTNATISIVQPGTPGAVLVQLVAASTTGNAFLRTGAEQGGDLTLQAQGDGKNVFVVASGSGGMVILRAEANLSRLHNSPTATAAEVAADASGVGKAIASLAWVCGLQKTFVAGDGIAFAVSADGKTITISATNMGGATSGYTGTRNTLADQQYDTSNHQFQVKYHRETWVNGVMTACTTDTTWTTITGGQAVEETV